MYIYIYIYIYGGKASTMYGLGGRGGEGGVKPSIHFPCIFKKKKKKKKKRGGGGWEVLIARKIAYVIWTDLYDLETKSC